jgi:hypothetical protein
MQPTEHARCPSPRTGSVKPGPVVIKWKVPMALAMGQNLAVVGGHPTLGEWQAARSVPLKWSQGNIWLGEASFEPG